MNHLVIFAKAPRLGRVKRRLAKEIGDIAAWRFYRRQLARILWDIGKDPRWKTWIYLTPDREAERWGFRPQGPGDIGRRMARPMKELPPGPVVLVGADIPALGKNQVARAFRRLGDHDAVLGPAADGGYYLIGLRRRPRLLLPFDDVRWSGPDTLRDTLARLKGARTASLEILSDVDDGEAYRLWLSATRRGR